jgi:hypothetical protein
MTLPPPSLPAAAAELMAAIDARGGNPAHPHGGDPVLDALWHLARHLLDDAVKAKGDG